MAENTSYLTLYPEGSTDPQSRQFLAGEGFSLDNAGGEGTYTVTLVSTGLLNSLINLPSIGLLVKVDNENFVLRDLQTDDTINLVNDNGVSGNITLGVNDNTTNQRFNFQVNGGSIYTGNTLNIKPINGAGANLLSNGDIIELTITSPSSSGGAPSDATYVITGGPNVAIPNATNLQSVGAGILKNSSGGALSTAVAGTDYVAPNANLTSLAGLATTKGGILAMNGTALTELAVGTDGYALVANSGASTGLSYASLPSSAATYIVQTADSSLTNEQSLGALTTGLLKNTVTSSTGVLSAAVAGTDYVSPNANLTSLAGLATTKGGILAMDGTALTEIPVGTDGYALVANSGASTGLSYASLPSSAATYIVQTADSSLTNEQSLGALTTGLLKNTVTSSTGVLSAAVAGTDYVAPNANLTSLAGLATTKGGILAMNGTALTELGVGSNGQVIVANSATPTGLDWSSTAAAGVSSLSATQHSGIQVSASTGAVTVKNRPVIWQYTTAGGVTYTGGGSSIGTYIEYWETVISDPSAIMLADNTSGYQDVFTAPFTGMYKFILSINLGADVPIGIWNSIQNPTGDINKLVYFNNGTYGSEVIIQANALDTLVICAGGGGVSGTSSGNTTVTIEYLGPSNPLFSPNSGNPYTFGPLVGLYSPPYSIGTFTIPSDYFSGSSATWSWNWTATGMTGPIVGATNYTLGVWRGTPGSGTLLSSQVYPYQDGDPQPSTINATAHNVVTYASTVFVPGETITLAIEIDATESLTLGNFYVYPFNYVN